MTVKERLKILYEHGVPLTEFARRVSCNKTTLGRWLRNETNLSPRLERDLDTAIDIFLSELDIIRK
jgi:transcriptional regulator with XRE-family HTH domain